MNQLTIRNEDEINELTRKIIGCAMEVHKALGNGFQACLPKGIRPAGRRLFTKGHWP
jgi:hypothetical protein